MSRMSARLVQLYQSAPPETIHAGNAWYPSARQEARRLAKAHGTSVACAAGVIAALSPRVTWRQNCRLADGVMGGTYSQGAFKANLAKAYRILAGTRPLDALGGPKVRAFYRAIMGDESAAVVDVWMVRAVRKRNPSLSVRAYRAIASAIAKAAALVGITVSRLQAVVWTVVRGKAT